VALWLGAGALLAHAVAWGAIAIANFLADSVSALLFLPLALLAVAVVAAGLGLGIAAIAVALHARPLAIPGAIAVVLGGAGAVVAVLTVFTMVM
jgi:hypothetical protein